VGSWALRRYGGALSALPPALTRECDAPIDERNSQQRKVHVHRCAQCFARAHLCVVVERPDDAGFVRAQPSWSMKRQHRYKPLNGRSPRVQPGQSFARRLPDCCGQNLWKPERVPPADMNAFAALSLADRSTAALPRNMACSALPIAAAARL
jgi:hypothetical protein